MAFAGDIVLLARKKSEIRNAFIKIEQEAIKLGLKINQQKTIFREWEENDNGESHFKIKSGTKEYNFEQASCVRYLGSLIANIPGWN